ncbi:MAG: IS200/IS605 family transposase [Cyanobacteria bacterium J06553_1]
MVRYKSNNNIVYNCKYHIVWVTKYRRSVLSQEIEARLKEILKDVADQMRVEIVEIEVGDLNHVHLLLDLDPQFGVHKVVKRMKGASSRYLRKEFPQLKSRLPTLWTNSYFVSTVGQRASTHVAPLAKIKEYIQNQKRSR